MTVNMLNNKDSISKIMETNKIPTEYQHDNT